MRERRVGFSVNKILLFKHPLLIADKIRIGKHFGVFAVGVLCQNLVAELIGERRIIFFGSQKEAMIQRFQNAVVRTKSFLKIIKSLVSQRIIFNFIFVNKCHIVQSGGYLLVGFFFLSLCKRNLSQVIIHAFLVGSLSK